MLALEAAAEIALERSVARHPPSIGLQDPRDLADFRDEHLTLLGQRDVAQQISVQPKEPRVHLVVGAQRVVTLAIRADATGDEPRHIRYGGTLQESLRESAGLILVGGRAGAPRPFDHGIQIHAGEHRTVLDRTPPTDGIGLTQTAILRGGEFTDVIPHDAMLIDEAAPSLGMRPLDRRLRNGSTGGRKHRREQQPAYEAEA